MGTPEHQSDEYCTECGNFVESLNEYTGWCNDCSRRLGHIAPSCANCGEQLIYQNNGKLCSRCKYVGWLERNADGIEQVMAERRISVRAAKKIIQASNRPICRSCGKPIKGGQKGKHFFCKKNPECIKGHTSYRYHLRNKPQPVALELAITASLIFKLTANISSKNREST